MCGMLRGFFLYETGFLAYNRVVEGLLKDRAKKLSRHRSADGRTEMLRTSSPFAGVRWDAAFIRRRFFGVPLFLVCGLEGFYYGRNCR